MFAGRVSIDGHLLSSHLFSIFNLHLHAFSRKKLY
jgi:hypothetical protein